MAPRLCTGLWPLLNAESYVTPHETNTYHQLPYQPRPNSSAPASRQPRRPSLEATPGCTSRSSTATVSRSPRTAARWGSPAALW